MVHKCERGVAIATPRSVNLSRGLPIVVSLSNHKPTNSSKSPDGPYTHPCSIFTGDPVVCVVQS